MNKVLIGMAGLCIVMSGCASMSAAPSGSRADVRRFDIPAEDATVALNDWSRQGNMQVLFDYSALQGRQTHAVEGMLAPRDALQSMLKDTGLTFSTVNEKTLAITPD